MTRANAPTHNVPAAVFFSRASLNGVHDVIEIFVQGEERKRRRLAAEAASARVDTILRAYSQPLDNFRLFGYLGRLLLDTENYRPVFMSTLMKVRKKWS